MPSLAASALKIMLKAGVKRDIRDPNELVRHLRLMMNAPLMPSNLPRGISLSKGRVGGVPGEWLTSKKPKVTLLYLHGGAFIGGRLQTYHRFCGVLAQALNARVFMPDYRLAPEYPYPAAIDDAFAAYRELIGLEHPLIVAGDSAGGNLTLVTLLRARDQQMAMPICAVAISPGADATGTLMSLHANDHSDSMLSRAMIDTAVKIYLGDADPFHPYASPSRGSFNGLPPLMITVSEEECLRDDAYRVAHEARKAKVPVTLLSRRRMPHVWPVFHSLLPEARKDTTKIVEFMCRQLDHAGHSIASVSASKQKTLHPHAQAITQKKIQEITEESV